MAERAITLSRRIAVPPERAFDAWTDPEAVKQWWRPHGGHASSVEMDVRAGGRYRIGMPAPTGTAYVSGEFVTVERPRRLAYTWKWETGEFADIPPSLVEVEFEQTAEGTEMRLSHRELLQTATDAHSIGWADCLHAYAEVVTAESR